MTSVARGLQVKNFSRHLWALLLALVSFALYSSYSYFQYKHYLIPSWDLGIFSQLAKDYASLQAPIVSIKGEGFNLWGDHFHPILVLLTPFYWLFPTPATLLYVQNALVAISVYLFCIFAQRILGNMWGALLTLAYALSFGIQSAVSVQFHEVAFALPFLVISLGYLALSHGAENSVRLLRRACWWALPLVFVKEDMGVTAAMIGLVILIRSGWFSLAKDRLFPHASEDTPTFKKRLSSLLEKFGSSGAALEGAFLIFWGLGWSALAMGFILPFFNTGGVFDYSDKVDLAGALGDPLQGLALMFYPWAKAASWGMLLLAGVLAWLFSPIAFVALPTLAWRFLSPNEGYWNSTWHYSLVLMPIIFAALLDTLARARHRAQTKDVATDRLPGFKQVLRAGEVLFNRFAPRVLPLLAALVALLLLPSQPLWDLTDKNFATSALSTTDQEKQSVVEAIPDQTSVAVDLSVLTYLIPDHTVYWIGHQGEPAPDYVVIDQAGSAWGSNPPADVAAYAANRYGHSYQIFYQAGTITVVQKVN